MDSNCLYSTNPSFLLTRLIEQYKKRNKIIIAYDIDDTVRPFYCADCTDVQSILRTAKNTVNAYFIVFTSNPNIDEIKDYLDRMELPYDSINENAPFVPFKEGKIFYNILLDDKAGLGETVNTLKQFLYLVKNGIIKKDNPEELHSNKTEEDDKVYICPHCNYKGLGIAYYCPSCHRPLVKPNILFQGGKTDV